MYLKKQNPHWMSDSTRSNGVLVDLRYHLQQIFFKDNSIRNGSKSISGSFEEFTKKWNGIISRYLKISFWGLKGKVSEKSITFHHEKIISSCFNPIDLQLGYFSQ